MAAVRDLDLSTSDAVFKSVINSKRFSPSGMPSRRTEELHKTMVNEESLCNPSHQF